MADPQSAIGLVFRISRMFGVAPVQFTVTGMTVSRRNLICSVGAFMALSCMLVAGLVLDSAVTHEKSIRLETSASALVWIANVASIWLMCAVGILGAPSRIRCVVNVLACVKKMKKTIGNINLTNKNSSDKRLRLYCTLSFITNIVLLLCDIFIYVASIIEHEKDGKVLVLYSAFYFQYLCFTLSACQFIVIASEVHSVMMMITESLKELLNFVNTGHTINNIFTHGYLKRNERNIAYVNNFTGDIPPAFTGKYTSKLAPVMHNLATGFGECCDLVRDVNEGFGLHLLVVIMNYFLELIVTPYYLMSTINVPAARRDWMYLSLQVAWAVYHLVSLCAVVQPAYSTQLEIEKTEHLLSRYLRHFKPYEPVYPELERFTRQLVFNKPSYSPLGVCTLSRQLCVTVLGAVTTYLVIILQFRAVEE